LLHAGPSSRAMGIARRRRYRFPRGAWRLLSREWGRASYWWKCQTAGIV